MTMTGALKVWLVQVPNDNSVVYELHYGEVMIVVCAETEQEAIKIAAGTLRDYSPTYFKWQIEQLLAIEVKTTEAATVRAIVGAD